LLQDLVKRGNENGLSKPIKEWTARNKNDMNEGFFDVNALRSGL